MGKILTEHDTVEITVETEELLGMDRDAIVKKGEGKCEYAGRHWRWVAHYGDARYHIAFVEINDKGEDIPSWKRRHDG